MGKKLWTVKTEDNQHEEYMFICPGCETGHRFVVKWGPKEIEDMKRLGYGTPTWTFNNNLEQPTFSPSLLYHKSESHPLCHSYVTNGKIQFLGDCSHKLVGQTVDLPDIDKS